MNSTSGPTADPTRSRRRIFPPLVMLAAGIALIAIAMTLAPDGHERAPLAQFIGRFHPLIVHLPIALILLVPLLEILGASERRTFLRQSAALVLSLATIAAVFSAALGWVLAYSGGFSGDLVALHLKGGVVFAVASLVAVACRARWSATGTGGWRWAYSLVLAFSLLSMTWAAHVGGQLTHGETYLTERMPAPLRGWFGAPERKKAATAADGSGARSVYLTHVQPIFDARCVSCHKPGKAKGELRLDSFEELTKGGENGEVINGGNPRKSELYRRITLPADDEDVMPSSGKDPLTAAEIRLIEWWIVEGASATMTANDAKYLPADVRAILATPSTAQAP